MASFPASHSSITASTQHPQEMDACLTNSAQYWLLFLCEQLPCTTKAAHNSQLVEKDTTQYQILGGMHHP